MDRSPRSWWARLWPALVPAIVLTVVYARTVQRTTGNYFSVDTTKFDYLGLVLGTAHPPGYPLYTMLNAIIVRVLPVGSVALRANLLSAGFAILTCVLAAIVLRHLGVSRVLAAGGATALGLIEPFWRFAVVAEVYTLTTLFQMAILACVLCFEATGRRGWLRVGVLLFAFSFSHATSNVLLIPGLLLYLALRRPTWLLRPRELGTLLPAGAVLALAPYAYIPWRTAVGGSTYLDSQATDLASLWEVVTAAEFGGKMFTVPLQEVWRERLPELWTDAYGTFGPLLLASVLGVLLLVWSRPRIGLILFAWLAATTVFTLCYDAFDWLTMLLPAWITVGLCAVVGLDRLARLLGRPGRVLAVVLAVALPVTALAMSYAEVDRSRVDPQSDVDAAIEAVPDNSIIFTPNNGTRHLFSYRLLPDSLGVRRNVWVSRGMGGESRPNPPTYRIRDYCAPKPGPWVWAQQERAITPSVARGLDTYVFGTRYARQVREGGLKVSHVSGKLYRVQCPSEPQEKEQGR